LAFEKTVLLDSSGLSEPDFHFCLMKKICREIQRTLIWRAQEGERVETSSGLSESDFHFCLMKKICREIQRILIWRAQEGERVEMRLGMVSGKSIALMCK